MAFPVLDPQAVHDLSVAKLGLQCSKLTYSNITALSEQAQ